MDKVYCCTIPFSSATQQHQAAVGAGKPARSIYIEGRGNETFETCIGQFRGPGTLGLCGGLRVLGTSRKAIMERASVLKARGIVPYDLDTGERDGMKLLDTAIGLLAGAKALRNDPSQPKKIGRKGGLVKGALADARRKDLFREDVVIRLCQHPKLTWQDCADILGGAPFSASTLRRKYGH